MKHYAVPPKKAMELDERAPNLFKIGNQFYMPNELTALGFRIETREESCMKSFDAEVWVKEFVETVKRNPSIPTDEGTMLAWFSSALMRGHDEGRRKAAYTGEVPDVARIMAAGDAMYERLGGLSITNNDDVRRPWKVAADTAAKASVAPTAQGGATKSRDWTEDASHENGKYQNRCVYCGQMFIGHKRRNCCRLCAMPTPEPTFEERLKGLLESDDTRIALMKLLDDSRTLNRRSAETAWKLVALLLARASEGR